MALAVQSYPTPGVSVGGPGRAPGVSVTSAPTRPVSVSSVITSPLSVARSGGSQMGTFNPQQTFSPQQTSNPQRVGTIQSGVNRVAADAASSAASVAAAQDQWANILRSLQASLRPPQPITVDIAKINAQARKQAESAVNPEYTKRINELLAREAQKRARAQEDKALQDQAIQDALDETLAANQTTRGRSAEDTATNLDTIRAAEDANQAVSGEAFDKARLAEAAGVASSGLAGTGIGNQQVEESIRNRNRTEKQQAEDVERQRVAQVLVKARTFEDLATSDALAGKHKEKGAAANKLNLDRLIQDIDYEERQQRTALEDEQYQQIAAQTQGFARINFANLLAGIRDTAVRSATSQAYGGLF